ncbi:MAG TPA: DUF4337 domain-containing protein [Myxococcales bacterium]|jgi:hypothetical protein|nr:DUF4337 domain-containing protein [Myxococcales bacterium]
MQTQGAPAEQLEGPQHALAGHVPKDGADGDAEARRNRWVDHAARTTAVLAVLAAVSSGQYAGQFSQTILAQAEASDAWNYYQAKSIKKHLSEGQIDIARAMAQGRPELVPALSALEQKHGAAAQKYEKELVDAKQNAERIERDKNRHQKMGDRFQYAFVMLQAGVVLSTVAASARRRELWIVAVLCGVGGLLMVGNGFLLLV